MLSKGSFHEKQFKLGIYIKYELEQGGGVTFFTRSREGCIFFKPVKGAEGCNFFFESDQIFLTPHQYEMATPIVVLALRAYTTELLKEN